MKNFTRSELAAAIAFKLKLSAPMAKQVVDAALDSAVDALAHGQRIEFRGFGTLEVVARKAKLGRNPANPNAGTFPIPPRKSVRFRLAKDLRRKINE